MTVSSKEIYQFTAMKIEQLGKGQESGAGKAKLAEIRRGAGKTPGENPSAWGILFEGMPEKMYAQSGKPSCAEWAIYTALTMYALHQQGRDVNSSQMQEQGESLGKAVSRLCHNTEGRYTQEDRERIERRFMPMATAATMEELSHHLRGIVQLLKAEGVSLDYPDLAVDLYRYQFPESRNEVRLKWGQDFYKYNQNAEVNEEENSNENKTSVS